MFVMVCVVVLVAVIVVVVLVRVVVVNVVVVVIVVEVDVTGLPFSSHSMTLPPSVQTVHSSTCHPRNRAAHQTLQPSSTSH